MGSKGELRILVVQEYGYRTWLWHYPGSRDELVHDWLSGHAPLNFFDPSRGAYRGKLVRVALAARRTTGLATPGLQAHVHANDDTYLNVDGVTYPGRVMFSTPG